MKRLLLLLFLIALFKSPLTAQDTQTKAKNAIHDLTTGQGCVVFVLPTKSAKIKKLKELSQTKKSQKELERNEKDLKKWITAFSTNFTICPIYFLPDTSLPNFLKKKECSFFINENLKQDCGEGFSANKPIYFLRFGKTNAENTTAIEALILHDFQMNALERPFPYFVKLNEFGRMVIQITSGRRRYSKIATSLNDKLTTFALKSDKIQTVD